MDIEQLDDGFDENVNSKDVQPNKTKYRDPIILKNDELITLYKEILAHITYLNENIINLDEVGDSNE